MQVNPSIKKPLFVQLMLVIVVWLAWILFMAFNEHWHLLESHAFMILTMIFGSFIAGATSEGGGAVAFPVMTLVFDIAPPVARDFSLMIQSVGMTAAAIAIIVFRIPVEWRAIRLAGFAGAFGVIISLEWLSPLLPPAYAKTFFLSFWLSFAVALYWINRNHCRAVRSQLDQHTPGQTLVLLLVGFLGGMITGLVGSGLDILTFSVLVLLFNLNEKVATPTSVILMASNAIAGFAWSELGSTGVSAEAWEYWWVCVPVVVVGAPLGAYFIRNKSRQFITRFLYLSIVLQYIAGLLIIPQTPWLLTCNLTVLGIGSILFWYLAKTAQIITIREQTQPRPRNLLREP